MLNRLVLPAAKLPETSLDPDWRVTLLVDADPGMLPRQVETVETTAPLALPLPVYREAPLAELSGQFAKIRTGGLVAEAVPPSSQVGEFLWTAAARRIPFKATAGLHHPLRSVRALTYAIDSPRAAMHGFVNVFAAAALAWNGMDLEHTVALLEERDPSAFSFREDRFVWRHHSLTTQQVQDARREFAHSFGSCSFEEPVTELRELGWLP